MYNDYINVTLNFFYMNAFVIVINNKLNRRTKITYLNNNLKLVIERTIKVKRMLKNSDNFLINTLLSLLVEH